MPNLKSNNVFLIKNSYWLIPLVAALFVRLFFFNYFITSPFSFYHMIEGLDMYTIYSRFPYYTPSIYSLFLRILSLLLPEAYFVNGIIFIQLIMGILTCLLTVFICYYLCRNKLASCISGVIFSVYGPVIIYEGFILKDSFYLFTATFVLFICFYIAAKKFSGLSVFTLGIMLFIPAFIRSIGSFLALLLCCWFLYTLINFTVRNRTNLKEKFSFIIFRLAFFLLGTAITISTIYFSCGKTLPAIVSSYTNLSYYYTVGQQKDFKSINTPHTNITTKNSKIKNAQNKSVTSYLFSYMENYKDFIKNYLRNFLFTFRAYEIPNNVNYYFIRKFLFPVSFMPGPIILFPFALAGLLFIFIYRKKYNNTVLLLLFILPVAAACTFFVPIARYRIVLIPVMAVGAGILLKNLLCFLFDRKYIKLFFASITVAIFALLQYMSMENNYYRASDYVAYGQAMRWQNSKNPLILPLFKKAFTIRPDLKFTKKNLIIECLRNGNFNSAKQLLQPEYKKNPRNFDTAINYASSLLGCKKFNKAYEVLSNIEKTDSPERKKKLYFNLGEYYFLTGRYNKAKNCYTVLLNLTDSQNIHAREVAEKRLLLIKQNIMEK